MVGQKRRRETSRLHKAVQVIEQHTIVGFDHLQAAIGPEGQQQLAQLAIALNQIAAEIPDDIDWILQVEGHTDDVGEDKYNLQLSKRRAKAVYRYLVSKGILSARLTSKGYGEAKPLVNAKTPEARAKNRRVEFVIIGN